MIGDVIGTYRIERELSEGGMSHVYVGRTVRKTELLPENHVVVLKIMASELAGEATAKKRFVKEAQILGQLRHRYITRFFEYIARDDGGVLVMEFVDGKPIDRLISEKGALQIGDAIAIAQCLLEALAYAHSKGIIHRDVKPGNIIQQKTGGVKVTDFGIAKMKETSSGQTVLTKAGYLLGTPHYMSPEQIRDPREAGASCDIYSAGVVLYEMLTGVLPFDSRSLPRLIDAIYRGQKKPLTAFRPSVEPELEAIVMKSLALNPEERHASAQAFHDELEAYKGRLRLAPAVAKGSSDTTIAGDARQNWQLVAVRDGAPEAHDLNGETVMVGRDRSCSIVLSHPAISRRHARITISGSSFLLEDLQSANGTFVNNARIQQAQLRPGDVVRFGADPTCSYTIRGRSGRA